MRERDEARKAEALVAAERDALKTELARVTAERDRCVSMLDMTDRMRLRAEADHDDSRRQAIDIAEQRAALKAELAEYKVVEEERDQLLATPEPKPVKP
jgi:hypothetical protein